MMRTFTCAARSLLSTEDSMATPCSVKALGKVRLKLRRFFLARRKVKSGGNRLALRFLSAIVRTP
jgi:hypothetical protein